MVKRKTKVTKQKISRAESLEAGNLTESIAESEAEARAEVENTLTESNKGELTEAGAEVANSTHESNRDELLEDDDSSAAFENYVQDELLDIANDDIHQAELDCAIKTMTNLDWLDKEYASDDAFQNQVDELVELIQDIEKPKWAMFSGIGTDIIRTAKSIHKKMWKDKNDDSMSIARSVGSEKSTSSSTRVQRILATKLAQVSKDNTNEAEAFRKRRKNLLEREKILDSRENRIKELENKHLRPYSEVVSGISNMPRQASNEESSDVTSTSPIDTSTALASTVNELLIEECAVGEYRQASNRQFKIRIGNTEISVPVRLSDKDGGDREKINSFLQSMSEFFKQGTAANVDNLGAPYISRDMLENLLDVEPYISPQIMDKILVSDEHAFSVTKFHEQVWHCRMNIISTQLKAIAKSLQNKQVVQNLDKFLLKCKQLKNEYASMTMESDILDLIARVTHERRKHFGDISVCGPATFVKGLLLSMDKRVHISFVNYLASNAMNPKVNNINHEEKNVIDLLKIWSSDIQRTAEKQSMYLELSDIPNQVTRDNVLPHIRDLLWSNSFKNISGNTENISNNNNNNNPRNTQSQKAQGENSKLSARGAKAAKRWEKKSKVKKDLDKTPKDCFNCGEKNATHVSSCCPLPCSNCGDKTHGLYSCPTSEQVKARRAHEKANRQSKTKAEKTGNTKKRSYQSKGGDNPKEPPKKK